MNEEEDDLSEEQIKKNVRRRGIRSSTMILFALLNVMFMVSFVWHTELYMVSLIVGQTAATFTNGFWDTGVTQVYHVWMYLMFGVGLITSYHLIRLSLKE